MFEREGKVRAVLEGENGRLFLGDSDGFRYERFISANPFSPSLLEVLRRQFRRRARELQRRGIPYVLCVIPDAHFIFPEEMPADIEAATFEPPGARFLRELAGIAPLTIVDPRADLMSAKGLLEIYRKTDTHWSFYGSFIGYKRFAEIMKTIVPTTVLDARDVAYEYGPMFGDLGVHVIPERREDAPLARVSRNPYSWVYQNEGYKRTGMLETYSETAADSRVMIFRDSFFTFLSDYIARSFRHMLCAGTTTSLYLDEVDAWRPDAVVTEIGERRIAVYESDHRREGYDDVYRADFTSPRGRIAQKALLQLDAGNAPAAIETIAAFELDPGVRPDHAYVAAKVLFAGREFERAARAARIALASHPERPSYLSMAASIELGRGDLNAALAYAERALAKAPYNGFHHETYAAILINRGEMLAARRHLEPVLAHIDDAGVLWYLFSLACEATGDFDRAEAAIVQAMLLHPGDKNFKNRAIALWQRAT